MPIPPNVIPSASANFVSSGIRWSEVAFHLASRVFTFRRGKMGWVNNVMPRSLIFRVFDRAIDCAKDKINSPRSLVVARRTGRAIACLCWLATYDHEPLRRRTVQVCK